MAVVVAQLVEQSLLTPEICRSYTDIGKILSTLLYNRKARNKENETGNGPSLKKLNLNTLNWPTHYLQIVLSPLGKGTLYIS